MTQSLFGHIQVLTCWLTTVDVIQFIENQIEKKSSLCWTKFDINLIYFFLQSCRIERSQERNSC